MTTAHNQTAEVTLGISNTLAHPTCESYVVFRGEATLPVWFRTFLYFLDVAYCFIGLSAITGRFFRSMENVVKQTRKVVEIDPYTKTETVRYEKVWNYTIADISLLAFGTSFPQISLATIDTIRNIGNLYAGGLGPGTLVGSAAFDLFPIHAVCVVVPKAGELKKISDLGVWLVELFWSFWAYIWLYIILEVWTPNVITLWEAALTVLQYGLLLLHAYAQDKRWQYVSLPLEKAERPDEWVPPEVDPIKDNRKFDEYLMMPEDESTGIVDIFSVHSASGTGHVYQNVFDSDVARSCEQGSKDITSEDMHLLSIWKQQFFDALMSDSSGPKNSKNKYLNYARIWWQSLLAPWRFLFAVVPPYQIAHGWVAFISSLIFISGIAYIVTKLSDVISCVTGINAYVIAFTVLASGTSWPDLVASKIAAERQLTADSAIANITCRFLQGVSIAHHVFDKMSTPERSYATAAAASVIDANHPYYLHPSDNPGMLLTTVVLNEQNYSQWNRSMIIALSSKLKLGFVDGSCNKPALTSPLSALWMRCNHMVISWILNSVSTDIRNSIVYMNSAHLIWKDLETRYSQSNLPKLFNLRKDISQITQGSLTIASYYTKFKTLSDELDSLSARPRCTCTHCTCNVNTKSDQYECTIQLTQFLMGLSEQFTSVRGQILLMKPVPTLSQCYSILLQEETQRDVQQSSYMTGHSLAMNVKNSYSGPQRKFGQNGSTSSSMSKKTTDDTLMCDFCHLKGHIRDTCFCLHGYPQWHRLFGKPKPKPRAKANNVTSTPQLAADIGSSGNLTDTGESKGTGLSDDQYQNLLKMIQATMKTDAAYSGTSSANTVQFAGPYMEEGCRDW